MREKFILISLDNKESLATQEQREAMMSLFDAKPVVGSYKGQVENSFLVDYKYLDSMLQVAERFKQESVLVNDGLSIYLVDPISLEYNKIGSYFRMSNFQPESESWTLIDQTYYYL